VAVYLSGAVGALAIGQEYRHNTIRLAFTGEPVRGRVLAAKVVVTTIMGLAIGLVSGLLCLAVGTVVLGAKDVAFGLSNGSENGVAFVGVVILSGLFTLCGFGLGAIMRTPAGAIPALMVWPLIPEPLIAALAPGVGKWFPFNAGGQLANNGVADGGVEAVSRLTGGLVFGGFVALVVTAGWILVERRDA
jgi:ABC-2 type transport system permease protein